MEGNNKDLIDSGGRSIQICRPSRKEGDPAAILK